MISKDQERSTLARLLVRNKYLISDIHTQYILQFYKNYDSKYVGQIVVGPNIGWERWNSKDAAFKKEWLFENGNRAI